MSNSINYCFLCLEIHETLNNIMIQDNEGTTLEVKLQKLLPEYILLDPKFPKYICINCLENANRTYKFRIRCSENLTVLNEYVQKLKSKNGVCNYSSIALNNILNHKQSRISESLNKKQNEQIWAENEVEHIFIKTEDTSNDGEGVREEINEELMLKNEDVVQDTNEDSLDYEGVIVPESFTNLIASRWGNASTEEIANKIEESVPSNTRRSKKYAWRLFMDFCNNRNYVLEKNTTRAQLCTILRDYAFNMKRKDGTDYKENVVKSIWNITAKILQEKYFKDYNIVIDPFKDMEFLSARQAKDAKRRQLRYDKDKRTKSSDAFTPQELSQIHNYWAEDNPEGLQKKFYFIAAKELSWKINECVNARLQYFIPEKNSVGQHTGRIEYIPASTNKNKIRLDRRFLTTNLTNPNLCPVRLFYKILKMRPSHVTTDRLFLTPNQNWNLKNNNGWYKNSPVGVNTLSKWTIETAKLIGLDTKNKRITNHSNRSSTVTQHYE